MTEELKTLLGECVLKQVEFVGSVGSRYTVQDLIDDSMGLRTLNKMWKNLKKTLTDISEDSLFDNPSSNKVAELRLKINTVEAIFKYKKAKAEEEKERDRAKVEASRRLAHLKNIKDEKELEKMGKMTIEDINKEIAALEN